MSLTSVHLTNPEMEQLRKFVLHLHTCGKCMHSNSNTPALRLCSHGIYLAVRAKDVLAIRPDFNPNATSKPATLW